MSPRAAALLEAYGFPEVYDYIDGKAEWLARGLPDEGEQASQKTLGDIAHRQVPTARVDDPAEPLMKRLDDAGEPVCVVLEPDSDIVLGLVRRADLNHANGQRVEAMMAPGPSTWRPSAALDAPLDYMDKHQVGTVLVTTSRGALIGLVDRAVIEGGGASG